MLAKDDKHAGYGLVARQKNNYPRKNSEFENLSKAIDDFVLPESLGLTISPDTRFFLQGSCFVENLHSELVARGYKSEFNDFVEALNSPLANMKFLGELLQRPNDPAYQSILNSDVYVLTIGVAPCWFLNSTGEFVSRPDPKNMAPYHQRTIKVREAVQALLYIFGAIYTINPKIQIVVTLSPVPIGSTFERESAIVADCLSKSVLRAAMHEAIDEFKGKKPIYFPSFEVVRWIGGHAGNAFGDDGLPRHVSKTYVKQIVESFLKRSR